MDIEVRGGERMSATGRALERAAAQLPTALQAALQRAAKPVIAAGRANAQRLLPHRGGLGAEVARSRFQVQPLHTAHGAGVRIHTSDHDARIDSAGRVRHPVYGHDAWVTQYVHPGWLSTATKQCTPAVEKEITAAVQALTSAVGR